MNTNDVLNLARLTHVRELKSEVARLSQELAATRAELDAVRHHFALALEAALDAEHLPENGRLLIVDGWNALLGSASLLTVEEKRLPMPEKESRLVELVRAWLDAHPLDSAWIVFDGAQAGGRAEPRLRISFTGGGGAHRADRMVCDYLRMRRFAGASKSVLVVTEDKDFRKEAQSLGAQVLSVGELEGTATGTKAT